MVKNGKKETIVLAHGYPGFVKLGAIEYFRGVADHLRNRLNVDVIVPQVGPTGTIADRSGQLERQLQDHFQKKRLHIIAHSVGGLDARHLVCDRPQGRGRSDMVATLTTIGTPHHGTCLAEIASGERKLSAIETAKLVSRIFEDLRDIKAVHITTGEFEDVIEFFLGREEAQTVDFLSVFEAIQKTILDVAGYASRLINTGNNGLGELTKTSMAKTNDELANAEGVTYFSYAGRAGVEEKDNLPIILYPAYIVVSLLEGENDGWISFKSATKDHFTRTILADHIQQVGHNLPSIGGNDPPTFNHLEFYERIVTEAIRNG